MINFRDSWTVRHICHQNPSIPDTCIKTLPLTSFYPGTYSKKRPEYKMAGINWTGEDKRRNNPTLGNPNWDRPIYSPMSFDMFHHPNRFNDLDSVE